MYGSSLQERKLHFAERLKSHPDFINLDFTDAINLYKNNDVKIPVRCKIHQSIFMLKPSNLVNGYRCPECAMESRKQKLSALSGAKSPFVSSLSSALQKARSKHDGFYCYDLITDDNWSGTTVKYKIICPVHGEFEQNFSSHLSGKGCKQCGKSKISKSLTKGKDHYINKAKSVHGDDFDYSLIRNENLSVEDQIEIICNECHHQFSVRVGNHVYNKTGCPKCEEQNRLKRIEGMTEANTKNHDYYIKKAIEINGDLYDYSKVGDVEYAGHLTKVPIICKNHEHGIFYQSWSAHIYMKEGCPKCNRSKMERELAKKLTERGIKFEEEKEFDGLIGIFGKPLRFDFYLPEYNICIECDGIQHFQYCPGLHSSEEDFLRRQEHDRRKEEFCHKASIRLLRLTNSNFDLF